MPNGSKIFVGLYIRDWILNMVEIHCVESEQEAHSLALHTKNCYGYYLTYYVLTDESKARKRVIFGDIYTLEQIKDMDKVWLLRLSMKLHRYDKAVKTKCGNWVEWSEDVEYISK